MSGESKVKLKSGDGEIFEVDEAVASESMTLKSVLEDRKGTIPLRNVPAKPLAKLLEYCQYHVEIRKKSENGEAVPDDVVKQWDARFINISYDDLTGLISAANYLNAKNLVELASQAVVDMISGKNPAAEIRLICNIKNDFTREEEEETRHNQWALN